MITNILEKFYNMIVEIFGETDLTRSLGSSLFLSYARLKAIFSISTFSKELWGVYVMIFFIVLAMLPIPGTDPLPFLILSEDYMLGVYILLVGMALSFSVFFYGFIQRDARYSVRILLGDTIEVIEGEGNKTPFVFFVALLVLAVLYLLQYSWTGHTLNFFNIFNVLIIVVGPLVSGNSLKSFAKHSVPMMASLMLVITGWLFLAVR